MTRVDRSRSGLRDATTVCLSRSVRSRGHHEVTVVVVVGESSRKPHERNNVHNDTRVFRRFFPLPPPRGRFYLKIYRRSLHYGNRGEFVRTVILSSSRINVVYLRRIYIFVVGRKRVLRPGGSRDFSTPSPSEIERRHNVTGSTIVRRDLNTTRLIRRKHVIIHIRRLQCYINNFLL